MQTWLLKRFHSASTRTRWFWAIFVFVAATLSVGALLLRRHSLLANISSIRARLAAKQTELENARLAAATAHHQDVIATQQGHVRVLEQEVANLQLQIAVAQAQHEHTLDSIDATTTWEGLEKLRDEANR